ncbi:MAG: hypothetical protein WBZ50_04930 [Nitrososphaeraceae archaeon]
MTEPLIPQSDIIAMAPEVSDTLALFQIVIDNNLVTQLQTDGTFLP